MKARVVKPAVGIIMGSQSDYETMQEAEKILIDFKIPYEVKVVSAHRTPDRMEEYAKSAESRGLKIIIAGAGGAAHLPGMTASLTVLPVLGVPVESRALHGLDSLLSIVQMPRGVPVMCCSVGKAGAANAGLAAVQILSLESSSRGWQLQGALKAYRARMIKEVLKSDKHLKKATKKRTRK